MPDKLAWGRCKIDMYGTTLCEREYVNNPDLGTRNLVRYLQS